MRDSLILYIQHRQDSIARSTQRTAELILLRREILTSPLMVALVAGVFAVIIVHIHGKNRSIK